MDDTKKLQSKLLKHNDQHQDACFIQINGSLYIVIATKHKLSIHSVDNEDDSDDIHSNCIVNDMPFNYDSKIKEIHTIKRQNAMQNNLLNKEINKTYESSCSILYEWDSIFILFENGQFGWFYIDIFNDVSNNYILWLIAPNTNYKYNTFLNQLKQKSQSHSLIINDWKLRCQSNNGTLLISIFSFLGNVAMIIPIIWKNILCFKYLTLNDSNRRNNALLFTENNANRIDSLWQIRSITGPISDFKFIRSEPKNSNALDVHFIIIYSQNNKCKLLADSVVLFQKDESKLMLSKNADTVRNIAIVDSDEKAYKSNDDMEVIPIQLKSWNIDKLRNLLNDDTFLMMMADQHSINIEILKKIIQNEIIIRNAADENENTEDKRVINSLFPKQFIKLSEYDGLIVFDFAMFHYKDNPYNKKIEIYKFPLFESMNIDDMIIYVKYHKILSVVFIATYNGNIYYMNLDGIRHEKTELMECKLYHKLKYVNVNKILFDSLDNIRHFGFVFGELSSHKLMLIKAMSNTEISKVSSAKFIPQFNGIMDMTTAKQHKLFNDEAIYVSYGYEKGGCMGKYQCIVPTQSLLNEPQSGYKYLSKIINVFNKLLIFVIADQTRIRCLSDHNLPELEINGFETNTETLSVGYINCDILLQITINSLLVIDRNKGILNKYCVRYNNDSSIIYAEIENNIAAVIVQNKMEYLHELNVFELSNENIIKLVYSVQLKDEISCIKIIKNGVIVSTYNGLVEIYEYKSNTPTLSLSLNKLSFVSQESQDESEEKLNIEPMENIIVQSIVIMNENKLYIGTRNGWLIEYDLDYNKIPIINISNPIFRNIGDLPLILIPTQINIDEEEMNNMNITQFNDKNALLCISERCWILFKNKKNILQLWPLDYPSNSITYAASFFQDSDPYIVLIVNGCMDIVRLVLEPKLHCCYTKIGKTITKIKYLNETNHLLYVSKQNNFSVLNFIDKDALFFGNDDEKHLSVEYEANLSQCIVTDINIIDYECKSNNLVSYSIGANLVYKGQFKQCINPYVILIKVEYDKGLKKFIRFNELFRYKLFSSLTASIPYNIISFKITDFMDKILMISMGSQLQMFLIKDQCKLDQCLSIKLSDFIKDIIYDEKSNLLSILYEKNGIDIMNIRVSKEEKEDEQDEKDEKKEEDIDMDKKLDLLNIIKSWNGMFYSSKHLLLKCERKEKNVMSDILICDRIGNISLMSNGSNENILQHKYSLDINGDNKKCNCCFNDMIKCTLFHTDKKSQIVAVCAKGCIFSITMP